MWYKVKEIEDKTGLSKAEIWEALTKDSNLRKKAKSMNGVLQVDESGVEGIIEFVQKKKNNFKKSSDVQQEIMDAVGDVDSIYDDATIPTDDDLDNFVYNKEIPKAKMMESEILKEEKPFDNSFFNDISTENLFEEADDPVITEDDDDLSALLEDYEEDFEDNLVFEDEEKEIENFDPQNEEVSLNDEVRDVENGFFDNDNAEFDNLFLDEAPKKPVAPVAAHVPSAPAPVVDNFIDVDDEEPSGISLDEEANWSTYVKALKARMIVQNDQIRALNEYLETTKRVLLQDEKIVNILERLDLE